MKKTLTAVAIALVLAVIYVTPVFADNGGVPNDNSSGLGVLHHGEAPGQGGLAPGFVGWYVSGLNADGEPGAVAEVMLSYANPQGEKAGPK